MDRRVGARLQGATEEVATKNRSKRMFTKAPFLLLLTWKSEFA